MDSMKPGPLVTFMEVIQADGSKSWQQTGAFAQLTLICTCGETKRPSSY